MSIDANGWLGWAERTPGPVDKVYSQANTGQGYVPHSMVGYLVGWYDRLFDTSREEDGRYTAYAAASVHGSILRDGRVIQHYSFKSSCWASGNRYANTHFIALENEGGYSPHDEPLTPEQFAANVRIILELSGLPDDVAREACRLASHKLPIKTKVILAHDLVVASAEAKE